MSNCVEPGSRSNSGWRCWRSWDTRWPIHSLLRVACLGTIADLVPLTGENRSIAALGLAALGGSRAPGLQALMQVSKVKSPVSSEDVGFSIGA